MNCFYHEDRPAVAQCGCCGRALCKSCATKYDEIICDDCATVAFRQLEKEQRSEDRRFRICVGLGVVFAMFTLVITLMGIIATGSYGLLLKGLPNVAISLVVYGLVIGGIPMGWHEFPRVTRNIVFIDNVLTLPLMIFCLRLAFSMAAGWFYFGKAAIQRFVASRAAA